MRDLKNILLPTDFSENAKEALPAASALARRFGATLHLLHVPVPLSWAAQQELGEQALSDFSTARRSPAENALRELATELSDIRTELHVVDGDSAAKEVERIVTEQGMDLVVISTRGQSGLRRFMLGSTTEQVVRTAPCPVLVAREPSASWESFAKILVPTDFSTPSMLALDEALGLAQPETAEIVLAHILAETDIPTGHVLKGHGLLNLEEQTKKAVQRRLEEVLSKRPHAAQARVAVAIGVPSATLTDLAVQENADLIVIASRGREGFANFMIGSTAERVVRIAPCSVLVVKERQ